MIDKNLRMRHSDATKQIKAKLVRSQRNVIMFNVVSDIRFIYMCRERKSESEVKEIVRQNVFTFDKAKGISY